MNRDESGEGPTKPPDELKRLRKHKQKLQEITDAGFPISEELLAKMKAIESTEIGGEWTKIPPEGAFEGSEGEGSTKDKGYLTIDRKYSLQFRLMNYGEEYFTFGSVESVEQGRLLWREMARLPGWPDIIQFEILRDGIILYRGNHTTDEC